MADHKKESKSFEGKKVEIFLQTPLFRFRYVRNDREHDLLDNAVHVTGTIKEDLGAGVWVKVDSLSNMKNKDVDLPFEEIFIPYGKIDFMVLE